MKVLLARKFDPAKHNVDGWLASEKLDGMRAYWNGTSLLSRNGNPIAAPDWFVAGLPRNQHFDGELFLGRGKFQKTMSVCRKQSPVDSEWRAIRFMVFDVPDHPGTFRQRYAVLRKLCGKLPDHIVCVEHSETTTAEVPAMLAKLEAVGAEGVMLRDPNSNYERKRSKSLLKVKSFLDADATVIGHQPGIGRHQGRMGALLCLLDDTTEFAIGTGFTDAAREDPPVVGDRITFTFFELTKAGVPRFPAFAGVRGD